MKGKKKQLRLLIFLSLTFAACDIFADTGEEKNTGENAAMTRIIITAGGETFSALFYDNAATRVLLARMPLTVNMSDLNRNEKFFNLKEPLPAASTERPQIIGAGEIMLWSGNTLVLFYKTFSNSYGGYVRLGYVEDTACLAAALGPGNVTVTFTVMKE
ncbi:hypothetical protein K7I13_03725 [Brucepastera parasyntrophica]|uniref:cyclophilin-like fold protein n=1 Tax=Brucepastera parasyntrophica TaxID=2880008 RepID=UPI00210D880E|nr:cyclophilin-like fold protein [Brucepastera parasyntrophica]ULQ60429.1 hypothetical protein K7I13_03725 [Brucepastera parasyntrophica]